MRCPPEAVRFYTASLCLAFSPEKGSFIVIDTSLPEALHIHTHQHTHVLVLAGWEIGHFGSVFSVTGEFLSVCAWFCLLHFSTLNMSHVCVKAFESFVCLSHCFSPSFFFPLYSAALGNFCKALCICAQCCQVSP